MWEGLGRYGLLLSSLASLVLGFMVVVWYVALQQAKRLLALSPLQPIKNGCGIKETAPPTEETVRSSGSLAVDEELDRIITLCLRDYVQSWYHPFFNGNMAILQETRSTTSYIVAHISKRCSEPEFLPLFTEDLVNILIDHLHLYKMAIQFVSNESPLEKCLYDCDTEPGWSAICAGGKPERAYVRGVIELVLCLILPQRDFKSQLFRSLAEDIITEHVLLPSVHYVTTPQYINSMVIYLTKEPSFTGDSLITALSVSNYEEVIITLNMANEEINRIKRSGTTEQHHLELSSLSELSTYLSGMKESGLREANEEQFREQFREQFPTLLISIPDHRVSTEGRTKHAEFRILVDCQHKQGPMEEWVTYRRFADLHDLHLSLKDIPSSELPGLPSQTKAFNRLDYNYLETKKSGMESYLRKISSQEFLNLHPHVFNKIILFLTGSSYTRQSTEIARTVDKLVQPFLRTKSESTVKTPSPNPYRKYPSSSLEEEIEEDESDDDEGGVAILLTLLDEVFDVKESDQWVQRQLTNLLRQLLASMLSDKMGQRMMETLDSLATADRIAELLAELRQSLWPDGYQGDKRELPTPEVKHLTGILARSKLIGSVPDDLRRLLGTGTTKKGIFRLFNMFQHQTFNSRLAYRIQEALLCALFAERDLAQAFKNIRTQIKLKYTPLM